MKVKILECNPHFFLVKDLEKNKTLKLAKQFFKRRYAAGIIEVENYKDLPIRI